MAILKEKEWKYGLKVSYWIISAVQTRWNKVYILTPMNTSSGATSVTIYGYIDKDSRLNNLNDYVPDYTVIKEIPGVGYTLAELYEKIKESKKIINLLHPEIQEIKDINGNIVVPYQSAEYEEVETNWFSDAVDDI